MEPPVTGPEHASEREANDLLVSLALKELCRRSILDHGFFDGRGFADAHSRVAETFLIPKSSITTKMARILFGISSILAPRSIVAAGSALGNALIWLTVPVMHCAEAIVGLDRDIDGNLRARENFARFGADVVQIVDCDATRPTRVLPKTIDLLLLDVYSPLRGKTQYFDILEEMYSSLRPGSIVLAHDISYPKFAVDLAPYLALVRDRDRFRHTCSVPLDRYGLEITRR